MYVYIYVYWFKTFQYLLKSLADATAAPHPHPHPHTPKIQKFKNPKTRWLLWLDLLSKTHCPPPLLHRIMQTSMCGPSAKTEHGLVLHGLIQQLPLLTVTYGEQEIVTSLHSAWPVAIISSTISFLKFISNARSILAFTNSGHSFKFSCWTLDFLCQLMIKSCHSFNCCFLVSITGCKTSTCVIVVKI